MTTDLAAANMRKAKVLENQAALSLFTMPTDQSLSKESHEYLMLRRKEEMVKLRRCVIEEKCREATLAANATRMAQERRTEVERTTRIRIPPPPLRCATPRDASPMASLGVASPFRSPSLHLLTSYF